MEKKSETYYYKISVSYEIPYNVLNSPEPDTQKAKELLYKSLNDSIPENRYEKFSVKLVLYQLEDSLNYLVTYDAFFRSCSGLPMEEYTAASEIRQKVEAEMEEFFELVDCEYRKLTIIPITK